MKIVCPSCNKTYNVAENKIPGNQARGTCKNCGANIVIEGTGVVPERPVQDTPRTGDRGTGLPLDTGLFMDYPELGNISSQRVAFDEVLSPNKKGGYKNRKNRLKVRLLTVVSEVLDQLLNDGERVMRVGKGTAYYPAELLFGNGWLTMMYNHYAILATNQRILLINIDSRMKRRTHYLFQVLYEDIKRVRRGLLLGSLVFQRIKSKRRVFNNVRRYTAKELKQFVLERKEPVIETSQGVLENLCPACFVPLEKGFKVCPSCKAHFKRPKMASLRSLLLPGLGDLYLGHRALGIMELIGSLMVWSSATLLLLSDEPGGHVAALMFLLLYNGVDAMVTYLMAKKGYQLA